MLWSGLPLVTQPGTAFSARVGASLVGASASFETVVTSLRGYEDLMVQLSTYSPSPSDDDTYSPSKAAGAHLGAHRAGPRDGTPPLAAPAAPATFGTFALNFDAAALGTTDMVGPKPWPEPISYGSMQ